MALGDLEYRLRLDLQGFPSLAGPRPLYIVSNRIITVNLVVEQLLAGSIPPSYSPVNVSGMSSQWLMKLDIDDVDGSAKWNVAGSVIDGPNGKFQFVVPKASVNFVADIGYSEFIVIPSGGNPAIRLPLPITIAKQGVTI